MRIKAIIKVVPLVMALGILAAAMPVLAVKDGQDITASPTSLKYALDVGASVKGVLTIINDGTIAYDFNVYASPYNVSGEDYNQSFQLKPAQTDVSKWVTLTKIPYHLESGKHVDVPYQVTIPPGTGPGGYYAVIFAETVASGQPTGSGLVVRKRVGAVLYLQANGAVDERGQLLSFTSDFWQTSPPLQATLRLSNEGNVHYQADVNVYVADLFGHTKARIQTSHIVLPQTIRRIDLNWPGAPSFGLFKVFGTVDMLSRTETLPTHYVLIMSQKFFLIVVIAFLLVAIVCGGLAIRQRRIKKKAKAEAEHQKGLEHARAAQPPRRPRPPMRRM